MRSKAPIRRAVLCAAFLFLGFAPETRAEPFDIKAHYDKAEYNIPMRDGVQLFVAVYTPKDTAQRYPILMKRTPYSIGSYGQQNFHEWGDLAPSESFLRDGFIFVLQDVRGRYKSEGEFEDFRPLRTNRKETDETTDTYDTIEWLIHRIAHNNGRVGTWGISYPGWYTVMGMIHPHPALKAASPQATTGDPFAGDDFHFNGAFALMCVTWVNYLKESAQARGTRAEMEENYGEPYRGFGNPWAYRSFLADGQIDQWDSKVFNGHLGRLWENVLSHANDDEYWRERTMLAPLKNIKVPVLNVSGWFDTFDLYGQVETYKAIERQVPHNASTLVVGPWQHGGWRKDDGTHLGDIQFGSKTSEYFQDNIILPFFQRHLKNKGDWKAPEAVMFETGGNAWHEFREWPPHNVTKQNLYLRAGGSLSFEAPMETSTDASDEYVSDPAKPVPYTMKITANPDQPNWRIEDQRLYSTRPDVLTYETAVLDRDVTIAGPVPVKLFASTSGTDSDWVVKLVDIYPDDGPAVTKLGEITMSGYQMLVGVEVMRGRYRNSFEHPEPMNSNEPTPITFNILDRFHTFKKGHRIAVHVQSSFFPFIDRNPQTYVDIYHAHPEDYHKATQRISRSVALPSHLELPLLEGGK